MDLNVGWTQTSPVTGNTSMPSDLMMARSRAGWVISYAGCPISWASKLQITMALSTTKAEYVALLMSFHDVIPLMGLLKESHTFGIKVSDTPPHVLCKVFKDNSGTLEMACLPKIHPQTKHINQYFHHFHKYVPIMRDHITWYPHNKTEHGHANETIAHGTLSIALQIDHWLVTGLVWPVSTKRECSISRF